MVGQGPPYGRRVARGLKHEPMPQPRPRPKPAAPAHASIRPKTLETRMPSTRDLLNRLPSLPIGEAGLTASDVETLRTR